MAATPSPIESRPAIPYVALRRDPFKAHQLTLRYCGRDKRVLEVGCSTGMVSEALQAQGCRVTGIEIDAGAARVAEQYCERVLVGDIEQMDLSAAGDQYDVLLLADVLEHLREPVSVLHRLGSLLGPNGHAVISVPNVANWAMRLGLLAGRWNYTERGILDRTHLRFFTLKALKAAIRDAGFTVEHLDVSAPVPLSPPVAISGLAHRVALLRPSLLAYQFIVVARPERGLATRG
ncbi:MAG TPA: class I SAM-dependent methyltransferase [Candidatus Dormibacteraeota bacterium]|nr:class I SAM-dependent methyltransferase [Candidatus Dormibacteraeota bacterium]